MKLSFMLSRECILAGIKGGERGKRDILTELVTALSENSPLADEAISTAELVDALLLRENELSTGVGNGFAFPHVRLKGIKGAYILFATCPEGVEFACPDNKPVHFLFLTVIAEENANLLLQTRASLMRMLLPLKAREEVLRLDTPEKIWKYIDRSGTAISKDIDARDIMCPQIGSVGIGMTLCEAAAALHKHHSDALPILDEHKNIVGVLSCRDLFRHTMPEFFFRMKTLSFMKHMDPFEQMLPEGRKLRVRDILPDLPEFRQVPPNATLLELLFEICAHNANKIYIVDKGKLCGVVNRFAVVDKIITEQEGTE